MLDSNGMLRDRPVDFVPACIIASLHTVHYHSNSNQAMTLARHCSDYVAHGLLTLAHGLDAGI